MALDLGTMTGFLDLETAKFDRKLDGAKGKFGAFAGKLGKVAAVGTAAAVAAVSAFAVKGVKQFADFESGMNEVFTLMPGASKKTMGAMQDDVLDFVKTMGISSDEAVPALYSAISAGVPPDNVFEFMEVSAKAAKGGVTDMNTAVDGITSVVNAYGDQLGGAGEASDLMFTAVRLGKTSFEELSSSLFQVNPTAAALGVEFGDVTAAMATMTAAGTPTNVATTQLRQAFVELSKEGGETAETFEKVAGKSFKEFIKGGGNTQEALQLLEEHAKDTGVGVNDLFGSVQAGAAALSLTGGNTDSFSKSLKEMDKSAGATDKAFEQMDQGLSRSWEKIKAGAEVATIKFGEELAPAVQKLSDWVGENLPDAMEKAGAAIAGVAEFIGTGVPAALELAGDAVENVIDFFDKFGPAIRNTAGVITGLMLPALVRLGVRALVSAAQTAVLWAMYTAEAIKSAAMFAVQSWVIIGRWVAMGAAAVASAAQTAYVWALYKIEAIKGAAAQVAAGARVVASWVATAAGAVAQGAIMAAAAAGTAARVVASWALMGGRAMLNGAKIVAGWVMAGAAAAVQGAIMVGSMAITAASVVAGWVLMAVQSTAQAVRMAAAWFIALGPIGWVTAAVIAIAALVIANWSKIRDFTVKIWGIVAKFLGDVWRNIVRFVTRHVSNMVNKIKYWFTAAKTFAISVWTTIRDKVVGFVQGLVLKTIAKITAMHNKIKYWFAIIKAVAILAWTTIRDKVVGFVRGLVDKAVDKFRSFKQKVTDIFGAVKTMFSNVWNKGIKPIFTTLGNFVTDKVVPVFKKGVDKIKNVWESIEKFAKKPISFVIDTVINKGLIGAFNKVSKWIPGVDELKPVKIKGFSGGGYTGPGGVNQAAGLVHRGEHVIKQVSRKRLEKTNPGALDHINKHGTMPGYKNGGLVNPMPAGHRAISAGLNGYPGHAGTDYPAPVGTIVRSPGKGTVSNVGWNLPGGTGKQVWIDHINGLRSRVHHLSQWLVHKGQSVNQGTPVGKVGMTGNTTGPHAHWGVMDGSKYLNPASVWGSGRGGGGNFTDGGGGSGGGFSLSAFTDLAKGIGEKFAAKFPDGGRLMDLTKGIGSKAIQASKDWVSDKWEGLKDNVGSAWSGVKNFVGLGSSKDKVRHVAKGYGWNKGDQWRAIDSIVSRESGWDKNAANPHSNARGLFQKMTSAHGAIEPTAEGQARWGLNYMKSRYGDPVKAWSHWQRHNSYADGGPMQQGWKLVGEEGPELINTGAGHVYTASQTNRMLAKPEAMQTNAQNHSLQTLAARGARQEVDTATRSDGSQFYFTVDRQSTAQELLQEAQFQDRRLSRGGARR